MSLYFIEKNGKQSGPYSLEELAHEKITKDTLVWKEGLTNWQKALEFPELKIIIVSIPPPLPSKTIKKEIDYSYDKDTHALLLGIIVLIYNIYNVIYWETYTNETLGLIKILSLSIFIISIYTVLKSAKRQNRNVFPWVLFSIFLPPIALISIGITNKKIKQLNIEPIDIPSNQKVSFIEHSTCPACGFESVEGFHECPDCGLSLK
jgi:hypothetical protein